MNRHSYQVVYACSNSTYRLDSPSGHATHIRELSRALEQQGVHVTIFLGGETRTASSAPRAPHPHPLRAWFPRTIWEGLKDYQRLRWQRTFARLAQERRLLNGAHIVYERIDFAGGAMGGLSRQLRLPYVIELHARLEEEAVTLSGARPLSRFFRTRVQQTLLAADAAVVISPPLKQWLIECGYAPSKIHVIQNGVRLDLFDPQRFSSSRGSARALTIGFVGSSLQWYGLDLLLRVFAKIRGRYNVRLLIVGMAKEEPTLQTLASELSLHEDIVFTGSVPHHQIPPLIAEMDICVLPNTMVYTSPIKVFEYGAMGKATIAPRIPALEAIFKDRQHILFVPPGDLTSLERVIEELIRAPDLRKSLGRELMQVVRSRHGWEHVGHQLIGLFESLRVEELPSCE